LNGGLLGLLVGIVGRNMIVAAFPPDVPTWLNWSFDANVYGFLVGVTLLTGLLFGFVPAVQASRGDLGRAMRSGSRAAGSRGRSWLRGSLVVAEVALAMILLIGASLMVRAYINISSVDPGFDPDDLLTLRVALPAADYADEGSESRFFEELVGRVRQLPGVDDAAATTILPVGTFQGTYISIEGGFVVASYAVTAAVLLGLIAAVVIDLRRQKQRVADLEAAGGRRRAPAAGRRP
jgi:heme exporter protein CcmD